MIGNLIERINIEKEICKDKKKLGQLNIILVQLENYSIDNNFILTYSRIILDSWNYDDELGKDLLKFYNISKRG